MGIFNSPEDIERKANLKKLEDKRLAFVQQMLREGFAPERMLFTQTDRGGFLALCRDKGKYCLIVSPSFGGDEEYVVERYDKLDYARVDVHVKGEGMAGLFGLGKKGEHGVEYVITRADGSEARMGFVVNRNSWLEAELSKNPLLKAKRRRGDANLVWDFRPLDRGTLDHAVEVAEGYFKG